MNEDNIRPASPPTLKAINRLSSDPDGDHLPIYRTVIKQDIRKLSKPEDKTENKGNGSEEADEERGGQGGGEDEDDGKDPNQEEDIGIYPIVYYIYEVLAQNYKGAVKYWIFHAEYSIENGSAKRWFDGQASRAEAIAHVVEASSYTDGEVMVEESELDWVSKAADEEIAFPTENSILEYLRENKWVMDAAVGW